MEKAKKCIGEFNGKCEADATHWVDFGDAAFAACDACYRRYDAISRRNTNRSIEAEARRHKIRVS